MDRGDVVVEIWLKDSIEASKFSSDMWREICPGFDIVSVHPALSKEVTLLILDLPLNTKDSVVIDYVAKFGGKVSPHPPQLVKSKSGLWAGQPNGDRKYKADFTGQVIPMGTYHFLGGRRVRVIYPGNTRTCGRCHQPPTTCPGDGIASKCREKDGPSTYIHQHMKHLDAMLNQARDSATQVQAEAQAEAQGEANTEQEARVGDFPPILNPQLTDTASQPPALSNQSAASNNGPTPPPAVLPELVQSAPAAFDDSQPQLSTTNGGIPDLDQSAITIQATAGPSPVCPKGIAPLSQSQEAAIKENSGVSPPPTPSSELNSTGATKKLPIGLTLTRSQKKREKAKERKRKQRAKTGVESEALDTSSEDKLGKSMLAWIRKSQSQSQITPDDNEKSLVEYNETDDDSNDSSDSEAHEAEKEAFSRKVLSDSKSFFEDDPFHLHSSEKFKSVFATSLSLTPRASRPSSNSSTPKRTRSPSPVTVDGAKAVKTE